MTKILLVLTLFLLSTKIGAQVRIQRLQKSPEASDSAALAIKWETLIPTSTTIPTLPFTIRQLENKLAVIGWTNYVNRLDMLTLDGKADWNYVFDTQDSLLRVREISKENGIIHLYGTLQNDIFFPSRAFIYTCDILPETGQEIGRGFTEDIENRLLPGVTKRLDAATWVVAAETFNNTTIQFADAAKRIIASSTIGFGPFNQVVIAEIHKLKNFDILLSGVGMKGQLIVPSVTRLAPNGDSLWSYHATALATDSLSFTTANTIELADESIVLLVNARALKSGVASNIHMLHISNQGELIEFVNYPSANATRGDQFAVLQDGSFVVVGATASSMEFNSTSHLDFYILHIDQHGNKLEEFSWGDAEKDDQLTAVTILDDGKIIVAGLAGGGENWSGASNYIAQVDLKGSSIVTQEVKRSNLKLLYDPLKEELSLEYDGKPSEEVTIVDIAGRQVMNTPAVHRIDVHSLPSGVYHLQIALDGITTTERFVIAR